MEFNSSQIETYNSISDHYYHGGNRSYNNLSLENNIFKGFITIDLNSDSIEIPSFAKLAIERFYTKRDSNINNCSITIPLFCGNSYTRSSSDTILKDFFIKTYFIDKLCKIVNKKGEIYYGNKGIILDKDFNLLFLYTIFCTKKQNNNNRISYIYDKSNIYIHPKVFINNDGSMEKIIVRKLLPFYLSNTLVGPRYGSSFGFEQYIKPKVIIEDVSSKFIEYPNKPSIQDTQDDLIHECLCNNIDEIINNL